MDLTLLHTAGAHVATFDRLRDTVTPGLALHHVVRPDWLAEVRQTGATGSLAARIGAVVSQAPGPVICTCTTLGTMAEARGAMRVDRPMMRAAARSGRAVMLAYALDSTLIPSLDLYRQEAGSAPGLIDLTRHWPLFEAGETAGFYAAIARDVAAHPASRRAVVVLAQVSMAGAAPLLDRDGIAVLSSPAAALRAAAGMATTGP